eukprot:5102636-Amphidinium_carterae.1
MRSFRGQGRVWGGFAGADFDYNALDLGEPSGPRAFQNSWDVLASNFLRLIALLMLIVDIGVIMGHRCSVS